jgi:hypothetical protein
MDDPRHVFLDASDVMRRYGWGKTKGYQNLKDRELVPPAVMTHPPLAARPTAGVGGEAHGDGRRGLRGADLGWSKGAERQRPTPPAEATTALGMSQGVATSSRSSTLQVSISSAATLVGRTTPPLS